MGIVEMQTQFLYVDGNATKLHIIYLVSEH